MGVEYVVMTKIAGKPPHDNSTRQGWTAGILNAQTALRVCALALTGLFILGFFYTLYFGKPFFLPVTLAVFLGFILSPLVRALARRHVPVRIGAALVLIAAVAIVAYSVTKVSQPAAQWLQQAPQYWQQVQRKIQDLVRPATRLREAAQKIQDMTDGSEAKTPKIEVKQQNNFVSSALGWTKDLLSQLVVLVILLYFLLASGDMFTSKLAKLLPRYEDKKRAVEIARATEQTVSTYLFTVAAINLGLGICVTIAMLLIGMPNPLMWGVMAALVNFIPYFGPLVGVAILAVAGLVQFDSWTYGIAPAACYLVLHGVEANLITPTIVGRRLTLNPVLVFVSLMFWSWMWGVVGAFLAVPILMVCKIVCDHIEFLSPMGEFLEP